jgi:hypothetical protein
MGMAYLSCPHGQEIQKRAYDEIVRIYPDGDAWERCLTEEKVDYVTAFVKEVLRFWTVIPICLPRVTMKDIPWEGATIPAGTTFYMVSRSSTRLSQTCLSSCRMLGPRIMTPHTSRTPTHSIQTGTSRTRLVRGRRIMHMVPVRECAQDHIWRTGSCTQLSSESSVPSQYTHPKIQRTSRFSTRWNAMPSRPVSPQSLKSSRLV